MELPETLAPLELSIDQTDLPMVINVANKHYDANKYLAYLPVCRNCGTKPCKSCPMALSRTKTLQDLLNNLTV
jgi:hypothetical protein